jgi:hypothetical protein
MVPTMAVRVAVAFAVKAAHVVAVAETGVVVVVHVRKSCCCRYLTKWKKRASRESHD